MNCEKARDVVDSTLSGEVHIMAAAARDHIDQCAACREWEQGMLHALEVLESLPELQVPDISAMVMRQLPDAHPASLRQRYDPLLGVVAWLGTGWALVFLVAAFAAIAGSQLLSTGGVVQAWSFARMVGNSLEPAVAAGRALAELVTACVTVLIKTSAPRAVPLLVFVLADCAVLAAILFGWRRRGRMINACFV